MVKNMSVVATPTGLMTECVILFLEVFIIVVVSISFMWSSQRSGFVRLSIGLLKVPMNEIFDAFWT